MTFDFQEDGELYRIRVLRGGIVVDALSVGIEAFGRRNPKLLAGLQAFFVKYQGAFEPATSLDELIVLATNRALVLKTLSGEM